VNPGSSLAVCCTVFRDKGTIATESILVVRAGEKLTALLELESATRGLLYGGLELQLKE
jgi:hypothetical protein